MKRKRERKKEGDEDEDYQPPSKKRKRNENDDEMEEPPPQKKLRWKDVLLRSLSRHQYRTPREVLKIVNKFKLMGIFDYNHKSPLNHLSAILSGLFDQNLVKRKGKRGSRKYLLKDQKEVEEEEEEIETEVKEEEDSDGYGEVKVRRRRRRRRRRKKKVGKAKPIPTDIEIFEISSDEEEDEQLQENENHPRIKQIEIPPPPQRLSKPHQNIVEREDQATSVEILEQIVCLANIKTSSKEEVKNEINDLFYKIRFGKYRKKSELSEEEDDEEDEDEEFFTNPISIMIERIIVIEFSNFFTSIKQSCDNGEEEMKVLRRAIMADLNQILSRHSGMH